MKQTLKTEIIAGITTFMTMAYILFVNSAILADCGMDRHAVMVATALASGLSCILMGIYAKHPFALAPGMGLNAYFAYSVCLGMKIPWEVALGAVFLDGLLFFLISILPLRQEIVKGIPLNIKYAVSGGIGLFIALIGLQHAGIVVKSDATMVTLGNIKLYSVILSIAGLFIAGILMAKRVKGALLWTILIITIAGLFVPTSEGQRLTQLPEKLVALPSAEIFSKTFLKLKILDAIKLGIITVVFTFTFVDLFDTLGTIVGLAAKLGIIQKDGSFPRVGRVLVSDSIGTMLGAIFGTSTVTTYVESAAGISEGGRTGITAVTTGVLFLLSLFLWPLATTIPKEATAPALVVVGLLMLEPVLRIHFEDITESLPAFLTLITMPFTYSIANGLMFGIVSYVIIKFISGRIKEVSPVMYILCLIFLSYIIAGKV
ncbi:MAG: NCS2 family permease [Endomicrobia bacterium]|nr:NCS2 family permease [Endomicrobiia bacterium]MDW8055353.1 NCS2 family permease [Elusimicrobiota bacterium]